MDLTLSRQTSLSQSLASDDLRSSSDHVDPVAGPSFATPNLAQIDSASSPHLWGADYNTNHLQSWFAKDEGGYMLLLPTSPSTSTERLPLRRSPSRTSAISSSTATTSNTLSTVVPILGVLDLSLAEVCSYIDSYASLQAAEIVNSACYSERAGAVIHRFVVLELHRPNRKNVWLRLDRRRGKNVSLIRFLASAGVTEANDRALLSADKDALVGQAFAENQQVFTTTPTLSELVRLLRIIGEEIVRYRLWPENCWFFCSLIQQHLEGAQAGWFVNGSSKYHSLANEIRVRISARVWQGRRADAPANRSLYVSTTVPIVAEPNPILPPPSPRPPSTVSVVSSSTASSMPLPEAVPVPPSPRPSRGSSIISSVEFETTLESIPSFESIPSAPLVLPSWPGFSASLVQALDRIIKDPSSSQELVSRAQQCINTSSRLAANPDPTPKAVVDQLQGITDAVIAFAKSLPNDKARIDFMPFSKEVSSLLQAMYKDTPITYRTRQADFLESIGNTFFRAPTHGRSLHFYTQALVIRREACQHLGSQARGALALNLSYCGGCYATLRKYDEAYRFRGEALELYRLMYKRRPRQWRFRLAEALLYQGRNMLFVDQRDVAVKMWEHAIPLWREVCENDRCKEPQFIDCLVSYIDVLEDTGRQDEALAAQEELKALEARRVVQHKVGAAIAS